MSLPAGASEARRVGGGDINEAWHVRLRRRGGFVKTRPDAGEGEYALEAAGLQWLAEPGALRTPRVIEVAEIIWRLSGWRRAGSATTAPRSWAAACRTHLAGAPCFGDPGFGERLGVQARIGSLRLPNEPAEDWPTFYAQRRLLPLAQIASERGR